MALANFFAKTALAASQVLAGMTSEVLSNVLGTHVLGIVFDKHAASSYEARVTLELAANLAARLYPAVALLSLEPSDSTACGLAADLENLMRTINPDINIVGESEAITVAVVVGDTSYPASGTELPFIVYAGSLAWNACISTERPTSSGCSTNPFGASAAACFALANVFRAVFAKYLAVPDPDTDFVLSLFDYTVNPNPANTLVANAGGPDIEYKAVDLGETILAGVGAVGNAAVWALARLPRLAGTLVLVDSENVTLSNLQRYVLANQAHVASGAPKTDLAASVLRLAQDEALLRVIPRQLDWGKYLADRDDYRIYRVATAFDTVAARLEVQAALPRRILNAWTQEGDLGISRHFAFGEMPCLGCLYRPRSGGRSEAEIMAEAMVVPEPALEIRELLHSGAPVDANFIRSVAERRHITEDKVEQLLQYAGIPLREFYSEAFCGGVMLQLEEGANGKSIGAETPMAFQSALAGVMLAAEIVIDAALLRREDRDTPATRVAIDLLRPLSVYTPEFTRSNQGNCLCSDVDYVEAYRSKYEAGHSRDC